MTDTKMLSYAIVCTLMALCSACSAPGRSAQAQSVELTQEQLVARGKYLVTIGGCHDCHSPKVMTDHGPEPDPKRLLSGHPASEPLPPLESASPNWISFSMGLTGFVGPWGVSYAANLTPDETGIGRWSFEQFETAIRKGKSKGLEHARELLPPMPWNMYRNMTDEDLHALFAYLNSLAPVQNAVPQPIPPTRGA